MKKELFRGMEIMQKNESGTAFVCYSQFDMGDKYKIYTRRNGDAARFYMSFGTIGEAYKILKKIP